MHPMRDPNGSKRERMTDSRIKAMMFFFKQESWFLSGTDGGFKNFGVGESVVIEVWRPCGHNFTNRF